MWCGLTDAMCSLCCALALKTRCIVCVCAAAIQKLRRPPAKLTSEIKVKPGDTRVSEYACGLALSFFPDDKNM